MNLLHHSFLRHFFKTPGIFKWNKASETSNKFIPSANFKLILIDHTTNINKITELFDLPFSPYLGCIQHLFDNQPTFSDFVVLDLNNIITNVLPFHLSCISFILETRNVMDKRSC